MGGVQNMGGVGPGEGSKALGGVWTVECGVDGQEAKSKQGERQEMKSFLVDARIHPKSKEQEHKQEASRGIPWNMCLANLLLLLLQLKQDVQRSQAHLAS